MGIVNDSKYKRRSLNNIADVEKALRELEADLPKANLNKLANFNRTYLIITHNVKAEVSKGKFENPMFLNKFDTLFASYYIEAVKNHLNNKDFQVPPAWKYAFRASEGRKTSPFKCMVLGVNAHVNNDIPQVLFEVDATGKHWPDYHFVNNVIKNSIDQVILELDDYKQLYSPKNSYLKPVYKVLMHVFIRIFRRLAWRNYKRLKKGEVYRCHIELGSKRIAVFVNLLPI